MSRQALLGGEMIYEPTVSEGYEWLNTCERNGHEVFQSFDGSRRLPDWTPVRVRLVRTDEGAGVMRPSDFPLLGSALVLRNRAVDALREFLDVHGELLPLAPEDEVELVVLNVTTVLDALDEDRSSIMRIPGTRKSMLIKNAVFRASVVRGVDVFRLPNRGSATYVSRRFVDASNAAGLVGLDFNLVWSEPS